uniref:BHLH domain-containing protein n=1 Tax=Salix viminalis TaxID=40686 RepID=A0A6N2KCN4_SALVM
MFPFQQNLDEFLAQISSNLPYQEDFGTDFQYLIYGQESLHGICNQTISVDEIQKHKILASSNASDHSGNIIRDDEKKMARKEIERRRRKQLSSLDDSLRNLLPRELIKGKRSISDRLNEAEKYIKHLNSDIQELSAKRDKLKKLFNSSTFEQGTEISGHNLLDCVKVRPILGGVEIVVIGGCGEEGIPLSRVLEALLEEGFDAVGYFSTQKDERRYTNIQCQATDRNCIDSDGLQRKLNDVISLSSYVDF